MVSFSRKFKMFSTPFFVILVVLMVLIVVSALMVAWQFVKWVRSKWFSVDADADPLDEEFDLDG